MPIGMDIAGCHDLAVPPDVMHHVVRVESSFNPYAIGVVGARLARQPAALPEAIATARMLERRGYNFSLGLSQVNRHNLRRYGLGTYAAAFEPCRNLVAGSRILAECHRRARGDWGKAFSCYYSGDFSTGYRHGYVRKVFASMQSAGDGQTAVAADAIPLVEAPSPVADGRGRRLADARETGRDLPVRAVAVPSRTGRAVAFPASGDPAPVGDAATGASIATPQAGVDIAFVF